MKLVEKGTFSPRRVHQRRKELGLSLEQLARLTERSITSVHGWESGKFQPTVRSIHMLSIALKVKPAYFFVKEAK